MWAEISTHVAPYVASLEEGGVCKQCSFPLDCWCCRLWFELITQQAKSLPFDLLTPIHPAESEGSNIVQMR